MDDAGDSDVDYDLSRARADTARAADAVHKAGFRDAFGSAGASDVAMQAAFDAGYRAAVTPAYAVGILRGVVGALRAAVLARISSSTSGDANANDVVAPADGVGRSTTSTTIPMLLQYSSDVSLVVSSFDALAQLLRTSGGGEADVGDNYVGTTDGRECFGGAIPNLNFGLSRAAAQITQLLTDAVRLGLASQDAADAVQLELAK